MWSNNQLHYFEANRGVDHLIVGQCALVDNGLMYGPTPLIVFTPFEGLHDIRLHDVMLEHYHFDDDNYCDEIDEENSVWLPSAERALVDTITFLDKNYIEGPLIESLQTYLYRNKDLSKLREVADFYNLPMSTLDYWIKEAEEETDMSMG